jgi:hypothetical protein
VRTNLSTEDLNLACAYLQILQARLPEFETVKDSLNSDSMNELLVRMQLLKKLYDCQLIVTRNPFPIDGTIDISKNWKNYYTCSISQ